MKRSARQSQRRQQRLLNPPANPTPNPPANPPPKNLTPTNKSFEDWGNITPTLATPSKPDPPPKATKNANHSLSASFLSLLDNGFAPNLLTPKPNPQTNSSVLETPQNSSTPIPKKGDLLATAMQECELDLSGSFNLVEPIPNEDSNPPEEDPNPTEEGPNPNLPEKDPILPEENPNLPEENPNPPEEGPNPILPVRVMMKKEGYMENYVKLLNLPKEDLNHNPNPFIPAWDRKGKGESENSVETKKYVLGLFSQNGYKQPLSLTICLNLAKTDAKFRGIWEYILQNTLKPEQRGNERLAYEVISHYLTRTCKGSMAVLPPPPPPPADRKGLTPDQKDQILKIFGREKKGGVRSAITSWVKAHRSDPAWISIMAVQHDEARAKEVIKSFLDAVYCQTKKSL